MPSALLEQHSLAHPETHMQGAQNATAHSVRRFAALADAAAPAAADSPLSQPSPEPLISDAAASTRPTSSYSPPDLPSESFSPPEMGPEMGGESPRAGGVVQPRSNRIPGARTESSGSLENRKALQHFMHMRNSHCDFAESVTKLQEYVRMGLQERGESAAGASGEAVTQFVIDYDIVKLYAQAEIGLLRCAWGVCWACQHACMYVDV